MCSKKRANYFAFNVQLFNNFGDNAMFSNKYVDVITVSDVIKMF